MKRRVRLAGYPVEEPVVNLTPLIDVVFVILIMFIVVAPLLELDRVELAEAPSVSDKPLPVQESSPIAIHVRKDNSIWVGNQAITLDELGVYLKQVKKQFPGMHPQLFHDARANFGTYQAVKNAAEMAGFQQLDIILKPT
jgi:biopolymer transport protein ExbD